MDEEVNQRGMNYDILNQNFLVNIVVLEEVVFKGGFFFLIFIVVGVI